MKIITTIILLTFFVMTSCSKDRESTSLVIFKSNSLSASQGGLMMWGVSGTTGESFAVNFTSEVQTQSISLANGSWDFAGVSWSGTNKMEGSLKCGFTSRNLTGGLIDVTLNMNEQNCGNTLFSASAFSNGLTFAPLKIITCNKDTARADISSNNCDSFVGKANSFRVVFPEFTPVFPRNYNIGLTSSCHNINDSDSTELTNLVVPVGTTRFPNSPSLFAMMVKLYSGSNCDPASFYAVHDYPEGLLAVNEDAYFPVPGASLLRSVFSGSYVSYLFIKDDRIPLGPPEKLVITAPSYVLPNTCSGAVVVTIQDANSQEVSSGVARTVSLSSTGTQDMTFYSDPGCTGAITSLSFGPASSNATFYSKKTTAETIDFNATSTGLTTGSAPFIVAGAGVVVKLDISGDGGAAPPSGAINSCLAYTILSKDLNSDPANVGSNTTVNLSYTASTQNGGFYSDAGCSSLITSTTISTGTNSSPVIYFKKSTAESFEINATSTGLTSASFGLMITL